MFMETNQHQPAQQSPSGFQQFMRSHTARFIIVGIISLVLLVPLSQLGSLIEERKDRQNDVVDQLKTEWGGPVAYYGIVMKVPVTETVRWETAGKNQTKIQHAERNKHIAYIYPEWSSEDLNTVVTEKYRGILSTPTFTADIKGKARFNLKDFLKNNPDREIDWSHTQVGFMTDAETNFKRIDAIRFLGKSMPVNEQQRLGRDNMIINVTAPFSLNPVANTLVEVQVNTAINGSQSVHYQSLANESTMKLASNWNDPAFDGTWLPQGDALHISEKGFTGTWNSMKIGSGKTELHLDGINWFSKNYSDIRFIKMVDHYQLNERTIKYGLLVFILTFAVFFLIQIIGKVTVHPLHYFMIGLALLLFYSLLLSFSEQVGFITAYIIASVTIVLIIVWYARSILKSLKFAFMSGISLLLLYAFLLVIVNLEIYALIVGSIGLLVVLAAIMSFTRKINFETT
jgi:inner membrane protein